MYSICKCFLIPIVEFSYSFMNILDGNLKIYSNLVSLKKFYKFSKKKKTYINLGTTYVLLGSVYTRQAKTYDTLVIIFCYLLNKGLSTRKYFH